MITVSIDTPRLFKRIREAATAAYRVATAAYRVATAPEPPVPQAPAPFELGLQEGLRRGFEAIKAHRIEAHAVGYRDGYIAGMEAGHRCATLNH